MSISSSPVHFLKRSIKPSHSADQARARGRVLIASDSAAGREMISRIIRCLSLETATAENGWVACDMALAAWGRGEPFDLILLDMHLPHINGNEAASLLRSMGYKGRIIALASDCGFRDLHERCLNSGCDGYASKPVTFEMLRDVVGRYLPQSAAARAAF